MEVKRPYIMYLREMISDGNGGRVQKPGTWAATVAFVPQ